MIQAASHNSSTAPARAMRVLPTPSVRAAGSAVAVRNSTIARPQAMLVSSTRAGAHLSASSETRPQAAATFFNGGTVSFSDASNAGNGTFSTNNGDGELPTMRRLTYYFADTSTAGNGTFTYAGAETGDGTPAFTFFSGNSTAGNGTFTCSPGQEGGEGSGVGFFDASTADNATFTLEGATDISLGGGVGFAELRRGQRHADCQRRLGRRRRGKH